MKLTDKDLQKPVEIEWKTENTFDDLRINRLTAGESCSLCLGNGRAFQVARTGMMTELLPLWRIHRIIRDADLHTVSVIGPFECPQCRGVGTFSAAPVV